jgi:hypothetical protein
VCFWNDVCEGASNLANFIIRERQERMLQHISRGIVELADDVPRRLDFLPAVVDLAQRSNCGASDLLRHAATRVVGEPPAISGPDEVVARDHKRSPSLKARNRKRWASISLAVSRDLESNNQG